MALQGGHRDWFDIIILQIGVQDTVTPNSYSLSEKKIKKPKLDKTTTTKPKPKTKNQTNKQKQTNKQTSPPSPNHIHVTEKYEKTPKHLLEFWCIKLGILSTGKLDSAGHSVTFLFVTFPPLPGSCRQHKGFEPCGAPWYTLSSDGGNSTSAPSSGERLFLYLWTRVGSTSSINT